MTEHEQGSLRRFTPGLEVPARYARASGDHNPIHLDDEAARAVGLPRAILHGLWTMAQAARVISREAGNPLALSKLSVEFRGFGFPGEELVLESTATGGPDSRRRVEFTMRQDERVLLAGGVAEFAVELSAKPSE